MNITYKIYVNKSIDQIKVMLIFLICFFVGLKSYCQFDSLSHQFFDNDSVRYDIIYVSHGVLSKDSNHISKHYIRVRMSKVYRNYLVKKDSVFWLDRLRNDRSDWATNLILYYLYDKDASTLIVFNDRKKWLRIKYDDIRYWRKFLSTSKK
jgi:hypothetical protein